MCSPGTQDFLETSFSYLPLTLGLQGTSSTCRTPSPVPPVGTGPYLQPDEDPVQTAPTPPHLPVWAAMVIQPSSPRWPLELWRQRWHPTLILIHLLALWPGCRGKVGMVPGKVCGIAQDTKVIMKGYHFPLHCL